MITARFTRSLLAVLALGAAAAQAADPVTVSDAWVAATVPGQPASGAFMRLDSACDCVLEKVDSPVAGLAQIHQMSMQGDIMRMQPVDGVPLPKGSSVSLRPDGYHVMLMKLTAQIKEGDQVPLTLTIREGQATRTLQVTASARSIAGHAMH